MATNVTMNGSTYSVPAVGDSGWGASLSNYLIAISTGTLQKTGGAFTLTAEVDFGTTYGLKTAYLKSRGTNVSSAGVVRLANDELVAWRNAGNSADLGLKVNVSNVLEFNGAPLVSLALGAADTVLKMNAAGTAYEYGKLANVNIDAAAAIAYSKLAALTASRALVSDGSGVVSVSAVTSTELGHVSGVTSALQTQIDAKQPLDSDLTAIAGLATAGLVARTGSGTAAARTLTAGSSKVSVSNGDGVSGNPTVDVNEANLTLGNIGGTLGPTKGGTGLTSFTTGDVLYASAANTLAKLAVGTTGQLLRVSASGVPEWFTGAGTGDVVGPASATDDSLARFNGTTGKLIKSGGLIVNADVSGAAAIAYSKLALTGSILNADVNGSAAIAYSKLNLASSIVNSDVNGSAAIAYSKLALSGSIVDADISGATTITGSKLQAASASNAGAVNTTTQSFAGNKTFQGSNTDFGTSSTANTAVRVIGNSGTLEYRYIEGSTTKWSMLHNVSNARWELYDYVGAAVRFSVTQGGVPRFFNLGTGSATNAVHYDTSTKELYYVSSSSRYKDNIRPLQVDSSKIFQLETRSFTDKRSGKETIGLIAEEVAEVLPTLVGTIEVDDKGDRIDWNDGKRRQGNAPKGRAIPDTVFYDQLPILLLAEVKKLRAELDALKGK
jgi:hypothetical protein